MAEARILPQQLVQTVESWVDQQLYDAEKWDNRELLDESSVFTLHRLAAEIYAAGFEAGARAEGERCSGEARRARERSRAVHLIEEGKQ